MTAGEKLLHISNLDVSATAAEHLASTRVMQILPANFISTEIENHNIEVNMPITSLNINVSSVDLDASVEEQKSDGIIRQTELGVEL